MITNKKQNGRNMYVPTIVKKKLDMLVSEINVETGGYDNRLVKTSDFFSLLVSEYGTQARDKMIVSLKNATE
jgi:hypothetical protein